MVKSRVKQNLAERVYATIIFNREYDIARQIKGCKGFTDLHSTRTDALTVFNGLINWGFKAEQIEILCQPKLKEVQDWN